MAATASARDRCCLACGLRPPQHGVSRPGAVMGTTFVLFVEDNDDLREIFVELITIVLERRCVGVGSYKELVALGNEVLACDAAILDINLGPHQPSGLDAYQWLRHQG